VVAQLNDGTWKIAKAPPATAPTTATAAPADAPVAPLPFGERPEVQEALRSPPDALGVPTALYALDPLLMDYQRERASQLSARRSVGAGSIVFGALFGALAAAGIAFGAHDADSSNQQQSSSGSQTLFWSSALAALSLGEIIAGVAYCASSPDPRPLQTYYRETYAEPR
jgi:hypothetical protein